MALVGRFCFILLLGAFFPLAAEVALLDIAMELKAELQWEPYRKIAVLRKGEERLLFRPDSDRIIENYREEHRVGLVTRVNGAILLSDEAAQFVRTHFAISEKEEPGNLISVVVIDPGHGGRDAGTWHSHELDGNKFQIKEKDVVLQVASELHTMLERVYPDKLFVLTRNKDVYISLEERVEIANSIELDEELEAIIFVSIHVNASLSNPKSYGYEVWYLPPEYGRRNLISEAEAEGNPENILDILSAMKDEEFTIESVLLAKQILDGLDEKIGDTSLNRGLFQESWFVVRNARMPSVLVELGFATNPEEAFRMTDATHLRKMAEGLYNGIRRFIEDFESSAGFTR